MPAAVRLDYDPFATAEKVELSTDKLDEGLALRTPQARVLSVLQPSRPDTPEIDWPLINRTHLGPMAGYTEISGSLNRVLHGIRRKGTTGDPHPGLIERGMVEKVELDIDGVVEVNYKTTAKGVQAYQAYLAKHGGKLPKMRNKSTCVNHRYREPT